MLERIADYFEDFVTARRIFFHADQHQPHFDQRIAEAIDSVLVFLRGGAFPFQDAQHFFWRHWHPFADVVGDVLIGSPHPNPSLVCNVAMPLDSSFGFCFFLRAHSSDRFGFFAATLHSFSLHRQAFRVQLVG